MPLNMDEGSAISTLERWYKGHCDGTWEHHLGITIETTDNPGWVLTFKELRLAKDVLADVLGDLLRECDSQVGTDRTMVRVFAPSLQQVLVAAAVLAERSGDGVGCPGTEKAVEPCSSDEPETGRTGTDERD
jgi:hypothetical protein